jgi:flagellar hook protein FlgE
MHSLAPEVVNQKLSITDFHKKITNHLKKFVPIRFKKGFNNKVEPNLCWVGGTYYSDRDMDKAKSIEILFEYPAYSKTICITGKRFRGTCYTIADTLLHEIIHMRQYRRRKFKILPDYASTAEKTELRQEQSYLGCSDEIDAYSFNIACELVDKFGRNQTRIINYLNENQKGKRRRHNSWRMYLKAFQHDHNHPIIQRVKKKIVRYLAAAEMGRPYRNKDWIDR